MTGRFGFVMAAFIALPLCLGCAAGNGTIVRGQNPTVPEAAYSPPGQPVGYHYAASAHVHNYIDENCNWLHGPITTQAGPDGKAWQGCPGGACGPGGCPPGGCGPHGCGPHGCHGPHCAHCGLNGAGPNFNAGWYPTHHHWYTYHEPGRGHDVLGHCQGGLLYPPENAPGAVVVYPYYTLKGPDDFFWPPLAKTR
jgi:hypothetical protein